MSRWTVALPETRQLDVLAQMLERRDVGVLRCPLVGIRDAPDSLAVLAWIDRLRSEPPLLLVIYTGEGIYRLCDLAERHGRLDQFVAALGDIPLLTRGPKPKRALRQLGVLPRYEAVAPTTDGVIETLGAIAIDGGRIGVQVYGQDPIEPLMQYLHSRNVAADCVAPYVYASEADDRRVVELIAALQRGDVHAIAFTSKAQVRRLLDVARQAGMGQALSSALAACTVAAVGPIVAEELTKHQIRVDVMPARDFFMKPLVTELIRRLAATD